MSDTILLFDAEVQKEVPHTVDVDGNGEIVLTSEETGRAIKLPAGSTAADVEAYAEKHKQSNEGQVSQESIDKKRAEIIAGLTGGTKKPKK